MSMKNELKKSKIVDLKKLSVDEKLYLQIKLFDGIRPWAEMMWKEKEFSKTFNNFRGKLAWKFRKIAYWVDEDEITSSLVSYIMIEWFGKEYFNDLHVKPNLEYEKKVKSKHEN